MIIRWVPASIRLVAYYGNLMLISSFLGIGLGAVLKENNWALFRYFPIILLIDIVFLVLCHQITMAGFSELRFYAAPRTIVNIGTLICIFLLNVFLFVPLGERIGALFDALPSLEAYTWDLTGSLTGSAFFGLFSYLHFSPFLGFILVFTLYAGLRLKDMQWHVIPSLCLCVVLVSLSIPREAIWSPYHFITIAQEDVPGLISLDRAPERPPSGMNPPRYIVRVNQDFYQIHETVDLGRYTRSHPRYTDLLDIGHQYAIPYPMMIVHPQKVLVVGAGGGKEAEMAVTMGATAVDAVEVDPVLVSISKRINPSRIYHDPAVNVIVNDARAFVSGSTGRYDLVVFGYLDSQILLSAQSNIRLDGFVYTVECFRDAYNLLSDNGLLSVSFACPDWLRNKLIKMLYQATGKVPVVYVKGHSTHLILAKGKMHTPPPAFGDYRRLDIAGSLSDISQIAPATDDWPYLYLMRKHVPADYILSILLLIGLSVGLLIGTGKLKWGAQQVHFFFLGAGFLLLQTKCITDCSLYFGATWMVTTLVVTGVLLMVLAANLTAYRLRGFSPLLYLPLLGAIALQILIPRSAVLQFDFWARALWVLLMVPLPIFFAGLIFSTTFRKAANTSACFGANLIGATVGGFIEYLGMAVGSQMLIPLIVLLYAGSALVMRRR